MQPEVYPDNTRETNAHSLKRKVGLEYMQYPDSTA